MMDAMSIWDAGRELNPPHATCADCRERNHEQPLIGECDCPCHLKKEVSDAGTV